MCLCAYHNDTPSMTWTELVAVWLKFRIQEKYFYLLWIVSYKKYVSNMHLPMPYFAFRQWDALLASLVHSLSIVLSCVTWPSTKWTISVTETNMKNLWRLSTICKGIWWAASVLACFQMHWWYVASYRGRTMLIHFKMMAFCTFVIHVRTYFDNSHSIFFYYIETY